MATKTCLRCGLNCADRPRIRDQHGRYVCKSCLKPNELVLLDDVAIHPDTFKIRRRGRGELMGLAGRFVRTHNPNGEIPVPIEHILEVNLEFNIAPAEGILEDAATYGVLACQERTIFVDAHLHQSDRGSDKAQFRFTLAHEYAHFGLHPELYDGQPAFSDARSFKDFMTRWPDSERDEAERQADAHAGFVLVPTEPLVERFDRLVRERETRIYPRSAFSDDHREEVAYVLAAQFEVPIEVIRLRLADERLWE